MVCHCYADADGDWSGWLKGFWTDGFNDRPSFFAGSCCTAMMSFAQRINAASAQLRQLGGKFSDQNMQTPPQASDALLKCRLAVNTNDTAISEKLGGDFA